MDSSHIKFLKNWLGKDIYYINDNAIINLKYLELPDISEGSNNVRDDRQRIERECRHEMNNKNVQVTNREVSKFMCFHYTSEIEQSTNSRRTSWMR